MIVALQVVQQLWEEQMQSTQREQGGLFHLLKAYLTDQQQYFDLGCSFTFRKSHGLTGFDCLTLTIPGDGTDE
jgi:hypothetical protein